MPGSQPSPTRHPTNDADDYCAICATIHLASTSFLPDAPQLPVLFIGISLKNLLGLALMCGAVTFWPRFFDARFGRALEASDG